MSDFKVYNDHNIGIVGFGFVGQSVYNAITVKSNVFVNDPFKDDIESVPLEVLKDNCYNIFVCVNTPMDEDGDLDDSSLRDVLYQLDGFEGNVIIKSTVYYDKLKTILDIVNINVCYNPEFLDEVTAKEDFLNQEYIVLGGNARVTNEVQKMYEDHFKLKDNIKYEHCSIKEASNFKYINNIKAAYDLMFWEFVHDVTDGKSRKMHNMIRNMNNKDMGLVGLDGYRGFGGACLPKDVSAFYHCRNHKLTNFLLNYNKDLQDHRDE